MKKIKSEDIQKMSSENPLKQDQNSSKSYYLSEIKISGGVLKEAENEAGVWYYGDNGATCFFSGVRMTTKLVLGDTAYQLNGTIHISQSWTTQGFGVYEFAHEYGHYLQQKELGYAKYYAEALNSAYSLLTDPTNHPTQPFEVQATDLGTQYLNAHYHRP